MCNESKTDEISLNKIYSEKCNPKNPTCMVKDVYGKELKVLFILESPEVNEVINDCPAFGSTGRNMSSKLIQFNRNEEKIGLGKLIKENDSRAKKFGIINVCNYPMQCRYMLEYFRTSIISTKNLNNKLRGNFKKKGINKDEAKKVLNEIYNDFTRRLQHKIHFSSYNLLIIPCGKLAESFYFHFLEKFFKNPNYKRVLQFNWIKDFPHPSRGLWSKNPKKIKQMIKTIKTI